MAHLPRDTWWLVLSLIWLLGALLAATPFVLGILVNRTGAAAGVVRLALGPSLLGPNVRRCEVLPCPTPTTIPTKPIR
jgi:hypothetical protein